MHRDSESGQVEAEPSFSFLPADPESVVSAVPILAEFVWFLLSQRAAVQGALEMPQSQPSLSF